MPLEKIRLCSSQMVSWLLTIVAALLCFRRFISAPALWRDEVHTLSIATAPTLSDSYWLLTHDVLPWLYFLLLRVWWLLGAATDPLGLRLFGILAALCTLAIIRRSALPAFDEPALFALVFFSMNAVWLAFGTGIRAHGLALMFVLIALRTTWTAGSTDFKRPWLVSFVVYSLALHASLQNAIFLVAMLCGAAVVRYSEGQLRVLQSAALAFIASLLTLAVYVPLIPGRAPLIHFFKGKIDINFQIAAVQYFAFLSGPWVVLSWCALVIGFIATRVIGERSGRKGGIDVRAYYCLTTFFFALIFYGLTCAVAEFPLQVWHLFPLAAIGALSLDTLYCSDSKLAKLRPALALAAVIPVLNHELSSRPPLFTNIPAAVATIGAHSSPRDLVLVQPWETAITFQHNVPSNNPFPEWLTIPPLADSRLCRHDLLMDWTRNEIASHRACSEIIASLGSGNRLWVLHLDPLPATCNETDGLPVKRCEFHGEMSVFASNFLKALRCDPLCHWSTHDITPKEPILPYENMRLDSVQCAAPFASELF